MHYLVVFPAPQRNQSNCLKLADISTNISIWRNGSLYNQSEFTSFFGTVYGLGHKFAVRFILIRLFLNFKGLIKWLLKLFSPAKTAIKKSVRAESLFR